VCVCVCVSVCVSVCVCVCVCLLAAVFCGASIIMTLLLANSASLFVHHVSECVGLPDLSYVGVCAGSSWLRIGTGGGHL